MRKEKIYRAGMNKLLALDKLLADDLLIIRTLVIKNMGGDLFQSSDESDGDNGVTPERVSPKALAITRTECLPPKALASASMVPVPPKAVGTKAVERLLSRHLSEVSVDSDFCST